MYCIVTFLFSITFSCITVSLDNESITNLVFDISEFKLSNLNLIISSLSKYLFSTLFVCILISIISNIITNTPIPPNKIYFL